MKGSSEAFSLAATGNLADRVPTGTFIDDNQKEPPTLHIELKKGQNFLTEEQQKLIEEFLDKYRGYKLDVEMALGIVDRTEAVSVEENKESINDHLQYLQDLEKVWMVYPSADSKVFRESLKFAIEWTKEALNGTGELRSKYLPPYYPQPNTSYQIVKKLRALYPRA